MAYSTEGTDCIFSLLYIFFCDDNLNDNSFYFYNRYKIILYLLIIQWAAENA